MLTRLIEWSLRNRLFVLVLAAFLAVAGFQALRAIPLDALPDLSDVQVIVFTDYPGQAPQVVEDQVTYPITTQMLAVPSATVVRGYSFFGFSFVYVIFEDGTDLYWARSRVLEYLNYVSGRLPEGVSPSLGPDASGVGWAYMYALRSADHDLAELRSVQDWFLKYELTAVQGVSEVASVGGFVRQYQITVDPNRLRAYDISLARIRDAVRRSNTDVGGRVFETAETEFMVRGEGYIQGLDDVRRIALGVDASGTPVTVEDVATVQFGPEIRRGLAELNGEGEVVGGIVVVRSGANVHDVVGRVKARLEELQAGLPEGVEVVPVYDRTVLIEDSVATLREKLVEEMAIVALVCVVFLLHLRSALVAVITLPLAVLMAFIVMYFQGVGANIMSLGGIAIAIGAMVDAAIVIVENAHRHLERDGGKVPHWRIIARASTEVGPTLFFALLVITISFAPIFALEAQEGRLFRPLAFTKTYAMAAAALLSVTLVPVLAGFWIRGRIRPAGRNPVTWLLMAIYRPVLRLVLRWRWAVLVLTLAGAAATAVPVSRLGSEFMPPLWEGDLLYMPTTLPGVSITKAREVLQQTDRILRDFPEVETVFGKVGRADTATDPAPLSMIETTILLKPETEWRPGMTPDRLIAEMDDAIRFPGLTNAWTMPIKTRIDMLSTGIKTPVGVKLSGPDLSVLEDLGSRVEAVVRGVPGTRSAYSERAMGGNYLNFAVRRDAIARYGLTVSDVQEVIQSAIGGMNITTTVEGLERYPVNLRYSRDLRDNPSEFGDILVQTPTRQQIPLGFLADMSFVKGPPVIKSEQSRPNAWIYVDIEDVDVGSYVENARAAVAEEVEIPTGYSLGWSGQYEFLLRARERMEIMVPLTLLLILLTIQMSTRSVSRTLIVLTAVPLSLVGTFWLLHALDYNLSIAVGVGIIALAGLSAETGVVMLLYLDRSCEAAREAGRLTNRAELSEAVFDGALRRVRPVAMLTATTALGLLPIMWSTGAGSDVMKRIAAPMVGGVVTAAAVVLVVFPAIYFVWRARGMPRGAAG
ncbi:MAG: efflux RND transporter permease subunit [Acidobacteria bacterium]|nr:efflux RND transporter permease subunit [Acidobacteriota bacterium]MYA45109.1 efflux RND transporter permease subunit [Acidobacteriota bacterium]MYI37796.1 efflux RND transporter permease subunit [Acidobacteriota bacterium]